MSEDGKERWSEKIVGRIRLPKIVGAGSKMIDDYYCYPRVAMQILEQRRASLLTRLEWPCVIPPGQKYVLTPSILCMSRVRIFRSKFDLKPRTGSYPLPVPEENPRDRAQGQCNKRQ